MSVYQLRNPETGGIVDIPADRLHEAVTDGLQPLGDMDLYNPETKGKIAVPAAKLGEALGDGLLPYGSQAQKQHDVGYGESFVRGAAQGASLGFADEITGLLESIGTEKTYAQARDESRENYATAAAANPKMTIAGELGGGLAGAFVPGMGLAKGAGLAKEALYGAKLGAAAGLGHSTADLTKGEVGQAATDTLHGAEFGGAAGLAGGVATRVIGGTVSKVGEIAREAVDPVTQRLLALGATKKAFMGPLGDKSAKAVEVFKKNGLFEKLADGTEPDLDDIARIADMKRTDAANKLGQLFQATGDKGLSAGALDQLDNSLRQTFDEIIANTPPDMRSAMSKSAEGMIDELYSTGGNLKQLWDLKKRTGGWAGKAWDQAGQIPPLKELYMKSNQMLDDVLEVETANFAKQHGLSRMSELNDVYGAMATLGKVMENKLAAGAVKDPLNAKLRDASIFGAAGGAIGGSLGGPIGFGVGSAAGGLLGQSLSSTSGRLMRARMGEALHVGQQQQAAAMGAIPRSTSGIQEWLKKGADQLKAGMPQIAPFVDQIVSSPPTKAEMQIRALMPMLQIFMAPSPFTSELDGRVSSMEDKLLATKMLEQAKLPPSVMAREQGKLNKDGTLSTWVWGPSQKDDPVADELAAFNDRLGSMGY